MTEPGKIAGMAKQVATHLRTRYQAKKHGGFDIYKDERIIVSLDTYVPNVTVRLVDGSEFGQCVFSAAYHSHSRPDVYRPGKWTEYLTGLNEKSLSAREALKVAEAAARQKDHDRRYSPIDDSVQFASVEE